MIRLISVATMACWFAAAAVRVRGLADCPQACACSVVMGKNLTVCQERGLTSIPASISDRTNFLDLSGNSIEIVEDNQFFEMRLYSLESIALDSSGVKVVKKNAFVGLKWLKELDLSNNSIVAIDPFIFSDNKVLEMVNFSGNPIQKLDSFQFTALPNLKSLDFRNCALRTVEDEAFSNLLFLETLNLKNNQLTTLPKGVFTWLRNLKTLDLHDNPWRCDCDVQNLAILLLIRRLYTHDLTCTYEFDNKSNLWQNMETVNVDCIPTIENSVKENLMSVSKRLYETQRFDVMDTSRKFSSQYLGSSFLPVAIITIVLTVSFLCLVSCYRKCRRSDSQHKTDSFDFERACYDNFDDDCSDISLTIEL